jgi:flagellar protein FlaJ
METHLPDYLQVVSTNLKGGMSFEKSLFAAIRPQFGVLSHEIAIAAKKVMTGHDMTTALNEFSNKYDSPQLRRSLNLIVGEVTTGGKVAYVIDEVVSGLKSTKRLKDEMSASVITYVIFIGAIVGVIAPALFALSFNLLSFMSQFTDKLAGQDLNTIDTPFNFTEGAIDPLKFKTFSWVATLTVAVMSAMIVSVIEKGHIRAGIKYIPIFAASSLTLYFVFMWILGKLFSVISI